MLAHPHWSTMPFFVVVAELNVLKKSVSLNKSKTNNLTVSRHRKVRALMCETPTNNSLASWDSGMWSNEKKRAAQLCARNSFPFLPKTELNPVGYPCVGWLLRLRRRYTHRCLQIWLPPAASDWIQAWDSAPQNTRKHKMASRTSAILGLLKKLKGLPFGFFYSTLLFHDEERAAVLSRVMENQSCAKHWDEANRPRRHNLSRVLSERATLTFLIRQLQSSQKKSTITCSMSMCLSFYY